MTLSDYARLKVYWFNPKLKTVTLAVRDFRDYGTFRERENILGRLAEAKKRLANEQYDISEVPAARAEGISKPPF